MGILPLELSNLENIKTINHKPVIKVLNEITSRLGAICSIPVTLLDATVTAIAGTILSCVNRLQKQKSEGRRITLVCLSNRMYCNIASLGIATLRILFGSRQSAAEKKIDEYITRRMKSSHIAIYTQ